MPLQPEGPESSDFIGNPLRVRCVEVVEIVTHYLDNALDARDHEAVDTHLAGCEDCVVYVSQIRLTIKLASATNQRSHVALPANTAELASLIASRNAHS